MQELKDRYIRFDWVGAEKCIAPFYISHIIREE